MRNWGIQHLICILPYLQIIDYWLLFFLITTSLNIAVHIVIDRFHRNEKAAVEKAVDKWKDEVWKNTVRFEIIKFL